MKKNLIKYLLSMIVVFGLAYLFANFPVIARPGEECSSAANNLGPYQSGWTLTVMDAYPGYLCCGHGKPLWYDDNTKWAAEFVTDTHDIKFYGTGLESSDFQDWFAIWDNKNVPTGVSGLVGSSISGNGLLPGIPEFPILPGTPGDSSWINPSVTINLKIADEYYNALHSQNIASYFESTSSDTGTYSAYDWPSHTLEINVPGDTVYTQNGGGGGTNNKLAYILAETDYGAAAHSASYVQHAFWDALGQNGGDTSGLYAESVAFENMHSRINGNYGNTVRDLTNLDNVKVEYDATSQKYRVGPFKIRYEQLVYNGRFMAGISQIPTLKAKKNENLVALSYNSDWVFSTGGIPDSEEEFYLVINYQEGLNSLESMTFNFKYLCAEGSYVKWDGKLSVNKITASFNLVKCEFEYCDGGAANNGGKAVDTSGSLRQHTTATVHKHSDDDSDCTSYDKVCKGHSYSTTTHYVCDTCGHHSSSDSHDIEGCTGTMTTHKYCAWAGDYASCSGTHTHKHSNNSSSCTNYKKVCKGHKCEPGHTCESGGALPFAPTSHDNWVNHAQFITSHISVSHVTNDGPEIQPVAEVQHSSRWYEYYSRTMNWHVDLTTSLAGNVWLDNDAQKETSTVDGTRDGSENGVKNVEVRVRVYEYNSNGTAVDKGDAIFHDSNGNQLSFPIYTDADGNYSINRLEAPGIVSKGYYVVWFTYDGQVYENTVYLEGANGSNVIDNTSAQYMASPNSYSNKSMAVEGVDERLKFDESFAKVTGENSIKNDLTTTGKSIETSDADANNENGKTDSVLYNGKKVKENDATMVKSEFESPATEDHNNMRDNWQSNSNYERYRMTSYTYYGNESLHGRSDVNRNEYRILYPVANYAGTVTYIMNSKKSDGKQYIDDYMLHINLGLQKRKETDISVLKDLYKMTVVVNEQEMIQEFNNIVSKDGKAIKTNAKYTELKATLENNRALGYTLGLYSSDVAYNSKDRYSKAIEKIRELKDGTELRVFATYAIRIYNNSDTNDVRINEITDYYDSTYTLVDSTAMEGLEEDGIYTSIVEENLRREYKLVADKPYYRVLSTNQDYSDIEWKPTKIENLSGVDDNHKGNVSWDINGKVDGMNKSTSTSLYNYRLKTNEYIEIFTTYEIDYDGYIKNRDGNNSDITLRNDLLNSADKNNIAEVSNYSTFYSEKDVQRNGTGIQYYKAYKQDWVSGKVDKDSAPNNINTSNLNDESVYEDDTCKAIPLKVSLETIERDMYGYVFEDKKTKDSNKELASGGKLKVGNGYYENGTDSLINDVKVSMYEVINLSEANDTGSASEYDNLEYYYEIPYKYYNISNNHVGNDGSGACYTSSGTVKDIDGNDVPGNYYLYGFLAGDYVLRFDYGTKSDGTDIVYSTDENGTSKSETKNVIKYNGQDYENTSFLSETTYSSQDGTTYSSINDKFLNLRKYDVNGVKAVIEQDGAKAYSVARDNESRRMIVDSYSRTIENDRGEILRDRLADDNNEYILATKMFAETPIMQIEVFEPKQLNEDTNMEEEQKISVTKSTSEVSKNDIKNHKYHINNINFGLEERAKIDIDLTQYIEKIQLMKDNETIFSVKLQEDGSVVTNDNNATHTDKLTYMTHEMTGKTQQGFYAISVEDDYLNGLIMKMTYRIKVINNSELDFSGNLVRYYTAKEIVDKATYPPTTERSEEALKKILEDDENHGISTNSTLAEILKLYGNEDATLSRLLSAHESEISTESNDSKNISINDSLRPDIIVYGKYVGRFYYENDVDENTKVYTIKNYRQDDLPDVNISYDSDKVVKTTVDQIIDYIDINASYDLDTQGLENMDWNLSGTIGDQTVREAVPSLKELVSEYSYRKVKGNFNIYDQKDNALVTDVSSNIVISKNDKIEKFDRMAEMTEEDAGEYSSYLERALNENRVEYVDNYNNVNAANTRLEKELIPTEYVTAENEGGNITNIQIVTTKTTASDTDSNNMKFDNLAEVLVYSNPIGRRDVTSVPGNAMALGSKEGYWKAGYNSYEFWKQGHSDEEYKALEKNWVLYPEDDAFAPEFITIIAPTGIARRNYVKRVIVPIVILVIVMVCMAGVFIVKQFAIRKRKK